MGYPVRIAAGAERDLALSYEYIHAEDSDAAFEWCRGLNLPFYILETIPNRNPLTPEDPKLRHLLYGQKPDVYRILYRVGEKPKSVEVLHIRHGAMKRFKPGDV